MASTEQLEHAARGRAVTLRTVQTSVSTRGYAPTLSELATAAGVSKRTAKLYLARLAKDGHLEVDPNTPRGIRLLG